MAKAGVITIECYSKSFIYHNARIALVDITG